jgi:sec-independent protein translocase protein TatA
VLTGFAYTRPVMFGLGVTELLLILAIVLIIFGAGKLPELGEGLGRGIRNFRRSVKAPDEIDVTPRDEEDPKSGQGNGAPGDRGQAPPKQS